MTLWEATMVGEIVSYADGGCPTCVWHLLTLLNKTFPEFTWSQPEEYGEVLTVATSAYRTVDSEEHRT